MSRIYINNEDKLMLINIKEKLEDNEKQFIERLLEQDENNRKRLNQVAKIYKNEKRKQNKNYCRSKKEIERRK